MKPSPGKEGEDGKENEKDESKLRKIINGGPQQDPEGILYVVLETMEEIDTSLQVNKTNHRESDVDDDFKPSSELPASCTVGEEGPLETIQDVSSAIQRNDSSSTGSEEAIQVNNDEPGGRGLRFRKSNKKRKKDVQKSEEISGESIFGTSIKPTKWSLSHYLQSVASTREKRIVAVTAWSLAFIGLIVALVFVTLDFVDSRKEMASTVRHVDSDSLDLPNIWLCTADSEIPPFMELPNETYRGKPLVWLDYIRGTHEDINATYPETNDLEQLSFGSYDVMGRTCEASKAMNPLLYFRENTAKPSCFYCLTLNQNPPLTIRKARETEAGVALSRVASLRISQNSFISQCRTSQFGLSMIMLRFFREELRSHHSALSERGILDFGDYDPASRAHDGLLWPDYRLGLRNATVDFVVHDVVDMFCNVYLFSGYFYPSTSKDIRYKFDNRVFRWERSGRGPYYPRDYFEYYTKPESFVLYTGNAVIGKEKYENRSMYDSSTVQVRTNHSKIGGAETLAVLRAREIASVELSRNVIKEREWFSAHVVRTKLLPADVRSVNNVYLLDIGYKSLLTRVVSDQQSVSWSAFSADFFGLTSLFMDVSVYTLIVSPLIMRGRRRALVARKRRMVAESGSQV